MMNLWSFIGTCDGELFTSTHLTEKGALLNAIEDILMFLGIDENPERAHHHFEDTEPPCFDLDEMHKMNRVQLSTLFGQWAEITWDNQQGYQVEIIKTQVQA